MGVESRRESLEVWGLFLRVHTRVVHRLEADMEAGEKLPLSWFDVLLQLSFAPGGQLRMHDLLPSLMLSRSGLTRRIDRMEEAGLVERNDCPGDARGVVVKLTPGGRDRLRQVAPLHTRRIQAYFAQHLSGEELHALGKAFRTILESLDEAEGR